MEVLAKGQLSYMILSCLCERDMYGLELIEEIKNRFGREIKLPSLYSNINRMKELKYISSYLKESTKGPKCSYSSITEQGREALEHLKEDFMGISVVKPVEKPVEEPKPLPQQSPADEEQDLPDEEFQQDDDYEDYFNLSDDEPADEPAPQPALSVAEENTESIEENSQVEESLSQIVDDNVNDEVEQTNEEKVEVELNTTNVQEAEDYNRKIYAAAKDFSRNKNKRSYSDNQIELALSSAPMRSEEEKQQDLTQLKSALLQSRQGHYQDVESTFTFKDASLNPPIQNAEPKKEEIKDDGVFITDRLPEQAIPKPKKIEPPRLNISLTNYDRSLPAPKRNVAVDPTCNDVKAKLEKLYAKAEVVKQPVVESDFENYDDLKKYYASQDVEFKVYERPEKRPKHNTNLLKFYVSLFVFGLIGVGSALLYMIFSLSGLTSAQTNFVYYLFPILAAVYAVYQYYNYKTTVSKVPSQIWNPAIVWSIFASLIAIIFLLNYVCGAPFDQATTYFSTILVPIYVCACATVGAYYAQIYAFKNFWK